MSGHSKWANIKHKKSIADSRRAHEFTKLSRIITLATRAGGPDKENNVALRLALSRARTANMPHDTITRAIEAGMGARGDELTEIIYEAFDKQGRALLILTATDNSNRTFAEIRQIVEHASGKMGGRGAVMYLFQKCGRITIPQSNINEDELLSISESLMVFDIIESQRGYQLFIPFDKLRDSSDLLDKYNDVEIEVYYRSTTPFDASSVENEASLKLLNALQAHEDVHQVFIQ